MNAQYHAVKQSLAKVNGNLAARDSALLASPYTQADSDRLYEKLMTLVPIGSKVTASYYSKPGDLDSFKTFTGTVTGVSAISIDEPSFHVEDERGGILLPGSVLAEVA